MSKEVFRPNDHSNFDPDWGVITTADAQKKYGAQDPEQVHTAIRGAANLFFPRETVVDIRIPKNRLEFSSRNFLVRLSNALAQERLVVLK